MYRFVVGLVFGISFTVLCSVVTAVSQDFIHEKFNSSQYPDVLQQTFTTGMVSFTLKLSQKLYNDTKGENVLFSPVSMYSCLSMAHLASSGATRRELAELINFPGDNNVFVKMHELVGEMMRKTQKSNKTTVRFANGLFIQKLLPLREHFNRQMEKYYDSEVSTVDFTGGSTATNYINEWISDKTEGRIRKIFQDNLSDTTRIAMASALFFSAKWRHPFSNESTAVEKFDTGFGEVNIPMMRNQKRLYYTNFPQSSFEAIALPYNDYEFVMNLVLPYANQTVKTVLDFLNVDNIAAALTQTQKAYIDYKIPRMKFQKSKSMKEELKKLGLNNFFEKGEFDNLISSTIDLDVSDVMHAVEMETNEDGTMASAASSINFNTYSAETPLNENEPIQFYLNRPFMFYIIHKHTFAVIFAAIVQNPLESYT